MTQNMVLRKVLRRRGYLVLWKARWMTPWTVGSLVDRIGGEGFHLGKMFVVAKQTSRRDFLAQQQLSRRLEPAHWKGTNATALLRKREKENRGEITYWRVKPTKRKLMAG